MADKNLVREVAEKNDDGTLGESKVIGATFDDVIDTRTGKDPYTLSQFYDNYMTFIKSTPFIYCGKDAPTASNGQATNSHIKVWIDTGSSNQ